LRRLSTWLAVLALLIQNALPLADAALHTAFSVVSDDDAVVAVAAPVNAIAAVSKQSPTHLPHACPICQFMAALGSFAPPAPTQAPTERAPVKLLAVGLAASPAARSADSSAAQPRGPPVLI
jgi:hypothetical protein